MSQHLDDEGGLVHIITLVVVQKRFIVAYRGLVTSGYSKPREKATPIYPRSSFDRMIATLLAPPSNHGVSSDISTPSGTPNALQLASLLIPVGD